jgi:hypothetical protein
MTLPTPKTYDEIEAEILAYLRTNLSPNISVDPRTLVGNMIAAIAGYSKNVVDNEIIEAVNQAYWDSASGAGLTRLLDIFNIQRIPASPSIVVANLVIEGNQTVPEGSLATYTQGSFTSPFQWRLRADVVNTEATTETLQGIFEATEEGPVPFVLTGQLNTIVSPTNGWLSVTNPEGSSPGRFEETDTEMKFRQRATLLRTGAGTRAAIESAIRQVPGVVDVVIFENNTAQTNTRGIPPNSFSPVLVLGANPDLALLGQTLATKIPLGIRSIGNITDVYTDIQTGIDLEFQYSTAVEKDVYLWIDLKITPGSSINETAFLNHFINLFNQKHRVLGQDLAVTTLFEDAYSFSQNIKKVAIDGSDVNDISTSKAQIVALVDEVLRLEVINIVVTVSDFNDE